MFVIFSDTDYVAVPRSMSGFPSGYVVVLFCVQRLDHGVKIVVFVDIDEIVHYHFHFIFISYTSSTSNI